MAGSPSTWSRVPIRPRPSRWRQPPRDGSGRRASGAVPARVRARAARLTALHAITAETWRRTGTPIRTEAAYRDVFEAFRPQGCARLLFAQTADGTPEATLLLLRSGGRVVEPYGGMTATG